MLHFCKLLLNRIGTTHVACRMSNRSQCSMSYVACHMTWAQVPRRISSVVQHMSRTSHAARHISNVERHTFHVARCSLNVATARFDSHVGLGRSHVGCRFQASPARHVAIILFTCIYWHNHVPSWRVYENCQ